MANYAKASNTDLLPVNFATFFYFYSSNLDTLTISKNSESFFTKRKIGTKKHTFQNNG